MLIRPMSGAWREGCACTSFEVKALSWSHSGVERKTRSWDRQGLTMVSVHHSRHSAPSTSFSSGGSEKMDGQMSTHVTPAPSDATIASTVEQVNIEELSSPSMSKLTHQRKQHYT